MKREIRRDNEERRRKQQQQHQQQQQQQGGKGGKGGKGGEITKACDGVSSDDARTDLLIRPAWGVGKFTLSTALLLLCSNLL